MNEKRETRERGSLLPSRELIFIERATSRKRKGAGTPEAIGLGEPRHVHAQCRNEKMISSCGAPSRPNGGPWRHVAKHGFCFSLLSLSVPFFCSPLERVPLDGRFRRAATVGLTDLPPESGNALSDLYSSISYYTPRERKRERERESAGRSHKVLHKVA